MIKIFKRSFLPLICLVISIGMITSCKKNTDVSSNKIELLSFGPTGARHGDTLRFFGANLNMVTSIDLTGATVAQSAFIQQTGEVIMIIVPKETQQGIVTLKTPQGDIVSKTKLNLKVVPVVTTMTLQARPGENITINGDLLNWVTRVTFNKNKFVDTFVSKTINKLVVTVPLDAETGPLVLNYSGTEPLTIQSKDTLKVALPVATSFSPNPVKHADNVTITGTNLDLAKKVMFTGVTNPVTTFVSQSATQLVIKIPAGTQKGKVIFEAASGVQTTSALDLDVMLPAITTMSPNPVDPGTNLTITGTNLNLVTSITFPNAPVVTTFVSQSATQIVVKVPTGVLKGKLTLAVLNSTVTVQSDILDITGSAPPPTIAFPFYTDVVTANWNGWIGGGWGGTSDRSSTTIAREGTKSVKIDYVGGYGSPLQLGGANVTIAPYTALKLSIYGAPGSGGKKVNVGINNADAYTITIVEGKWTDYEVPITSLGLTSSSKLTDFIIKEFSGTGGFTIYVDAIGLN